MFINRLKIDTYKRCKNCNNLIVNRKYNAVYCEKCAYIISQVYNVFTKRKMLKARRLQTDNYIAPSYHRIKKKFNIFNQA
jgi:hypothetical protein